VTTRNRPHHASAVGDRRAKILVRKSNKPGEDNLSFKVQIDKALDTARHAGLTLDPRLAEDGGDVLRQIVSGWQPNANREPITDFIKQLCEDGYSSLILYKLDRIGRRLSEIAQNLDWLERYDVLLISCTEGTFDLRIPMHKQMVQNAISQAEAESGNTSVRVRDNRQIRGADGAHLGGSAMYGWEIDCVVTPGGDRIYNRTPAGAKRLRRHRTEGTIVEDMVRWALNEDLSTNEIARRLNAAGHTTGKGNPWKGKTIQSILTHPLLCGWVATHDNDPHTGRIMLWTRRPALAADGTPLQPHEPLIHCTDPHDPTSDWARLQARYAPTHAVTRRRTGRALLAGMIYDAAPGNNGQPCGNRMHGSARTGKNNKYVCHVGETQPDRCAGTSVTQAPLEAWVIALFLALITQPDFARRHSQLVTAALARQDGQRHDITTKIAHANDMISGFQEQLETLDDPATIQTLTTQLTRWNTEKRKLEQQTAHLDTAPVDLDAFVDLDAQACARLFANATLTERHRWLDAIIDRIEIHAPTSGRGARKGAFGSRGFDPRRVRIYLRHDPDNPYTAPTDWEPPAPATEPVDCPTCAHTCKNWAGLAAHRRWKHQKMSQAKAARGQRPTTHPCPQCPSEHPNEAVLRNHLWYTHKISDGYTCPHADCGRSFPVPMQLGRHLTTVHNPDKEFCPTCAKYFKTGGLGLHQRRTACGT
jgi:DNA invertase Pin-like site-specific DNA recombinase